jgi:1-acyl-sn-glycerol-3-phosphate acyltransferase
VNLRDLRSAPLRLAGWEFETPLPAEKKYVCLAVPHTSNWDGVLLIALASTVGMKMSFMIKSEWLRGPMGTVLRRFGAVGINRSRATNVVQSMIDELERRDSLALVIPPEGTRGRADHWKSGFYHIAVGAHVPIVPGYLDYRRKRAGLGPAIWPTGDVTTDMDAIRAFYKEKAPVGHYPDNVGPVRLREEDAAVAG